MESWLKSVKGRRVTLKAPKSEVDEPYFNYGPTTVTCERCGESVMLVSTIEHPRGHCPMCGREPEIRNRSHVRRW